MTPYAEAIPSVLHFVESKVNRLAKSRLSLPVSMPIVVKCEVSALIAALMSSCLIVEERQLAPHSPACYHLDNEPLYYHHVLNQAKYKIFQLWQAPLPPLGS